MKDHREACDRWASQPQSEIGKVGLFDFVHLNGTFFGAFPVWIGFADRHSGIFANPSVIRLTGSELIMTAHLFQHLIIFYPLRHILKYESSPEIKARALRQM